MLNGRYTAEFSQIFGENLSNAASNGQLSKWQFIASRAYLTKDFNITKAGYYSFYFLTSKHNNNLRVSFSDGTHNIINNQIPSQTPINIGKEEGNNDLYIYKTDPLYIENTGKYTLSYGKDVNQNTSDLIAACLKETTNDPKIELYPDLATFLPGSEITITPVLRSLPDFSASDIEWTVNQIDGVSITENDNGSAVLKTDAAVPLLTDITITATINNTGQDSKAAEATITIKTDALRFKPNSFSNIRLDNTRLDKPYTFVDGVDETTKIAFGGTAEATTVNYTDSDTYCGNYIGSNKSNTYGNPYVSGLDIPAGWYKILYLAGTEKDITANIGGNSEEIKKDTIFDDIKAASSVSSSEHVDVVTDSSGNNRYMYSITINVKEDLKNTSLQFVNTTDWLPDLYYVAIVPTEEVLPWSITPNRKTNEKNECAEVTVDKSSGTPEYTLRYKQNEKNEVGDGFNYNLSNEIEGLSGTTLSGKKSGILEVSFDVYFPSGKLNDNFYIDLCQDVENYWAWGGAQSYPYIRLSGNGETDMKILGGATATNANVNRTQNNGPFDASDDGGWWGGTKTTDTWFTVTETINLADLSTMSVSYDGNKATVANINGASSVKDSLYLNVEPGDTATTHDLEIKIKNLKATYKAAGEPQFGETTDTDSGIYEENGTKYGVIRFFQSYEGQNVEQYGFYFVNSEGTIIDAKNYIASQGAFDASSNAGFYGDLNKIAEKYQKDQGSGQDKAETSAWDETYHAKAYVIIDGVPYFSDTSIDGKVDSTKEITYSEAD